MWRNQLEQLAKWWTLPIIDRLLPKNTVDPQNDKVRARTHTIGYELASELNYTSTPILDMGLPQRCGETRVESEL